MRPWSEGYSSGQASVYQENQPREESDQAGRKASQGGHSQACEVDRCPDAGFEGDRSGRHPRTVTEQTITGITAQD